MSKPEYLIVHTAAHWTHNQECDTSAAEIDRWHKARGWRMIGYHYGIRWNGTIEKGRTDTMQGAHTRGLNSRSLGICLSGHGSLLPA